MLMGCTDELTIEARPEAITIAPGHGFTPILRLSTCGRRKGLHTAVSWTSSDTTVATVHPANGRVLGRRVGHTEVNAVGERYGHLLLIKVTVR